MGGISFHDMLDDAKASESMDVDTSFLDEFRRTGIRPRPQTEELETEEPNFEVDEPPFGHAALTAQAVEGPAPESEFGRPELGMEAHDRAGATRTGGRKGNGGGTQSASSAGSGGTAAAVPDPEQAAAASPLSDGADADLAVGPKEEIGAAQELDAVLDGEDAQKLDHLAETEMSAHRKTDQQDAIQAAAGTKGGASSSGAGALPESGFRILGLESQPMVRNLPRPLVDAMRAQLRAAAVRERGVSDAAAESFSRRLSQGALVTAFLLAQLDVRMDTDPATQTAAELFRSQDPLLGSVVGRMDTLEQLERDRAAQLERLHKILAAVQETSAVIEQSVAYSIADRTENFLRGSHNIHDAPITHKDAIYIRDKAREETQKRGKFERDRDGRPIR